VGPLSRLYSAALLCNTALHTFHHDYIDHTALEDALERNHSIIKCSAQPRPIDFSDVLLFNRVSGHRCAPLCGKLF
jgi:hypothetical protein